MINHKLPALQITVLTASASFEALMATAASADYNLPEGANRILLQCEDGDIRYSSDGSVPTTALGLQCTQGNGVIIDGDIGKLQLIRDGSSNVKVNVQVQQIDPNEH